VAILLSQPRIANLLVQPDDLSSIERSLCWSRD